MVTTMPAPSRAVDKSADTGLQLPRNANPPAFDSCVWGGRFPDRRYYPFYLGNGRDAMLINISGSGDGHWERAPYSADVISKLHSIGWYKADRRAERTDCGVYGPLLCLGEFTACPMMLRDYVVPRDVRQYFDPKSATLTTFYSQLDHTTMEKLELRIETYLTSTGILIQDIEVLEAPSCGVGYAFTLGAPSPTYQNHMLPLSGPDAFEALPDREKNELVIAAQFGKLRVCGFSLVGSDNVEWGDDRYVPGIKFGEREQIVGELFAGARLWRAVSFQDDREGGDPLKQCDEMIEGIRRDGISGVRERHLIEWEEYFSRSKIEVPNQAAQFLYDLSRYMLKANHHPSGFQPVGLLPYQWQGAMFWDAATAMEAFVTSGNAAEARDIRRHVLSLLPEGRELAAELGNGGARIEWTKNLESFTQYDPPSRQFHNNAVWARSFCLLNEYLAEEDSSHLGPVAEYLQFMLDEFSKHGTATSADLAFVGIDESMSAPKLYDTWTCAVLLKALEAYRSSCQLHEAASELPGAVQMIKILREVLDGNVDEHGVLQSFRGGRLPHWGSLIFDMYPDHPSAAATIGAMSRNYDEERDMFNFHGLNRYAERAFPWASYSVARCLAKMGRAEAQQYFLHATNHVNYFGGIPERIFYHGENYIEWFSTGHAALVLGMNTMLATTVEGRLHLLGGIDTRAWHTLCYEGLHAGEGWVVSLSLKEGEVEQCVVENLHKENRRVVVTIPPLGLYALVEAEPGVNNIDLNNLRVKG